MKSELNNFLVCPICRQKLSLKILKLVSDEIIEGKLTCTKKHIFKISNGIPRFVTDPSKDFQKTEDAFSSKWKNYHKTYHDKKWVDKQKKWFFDRFGWKNISEFKNFLKKSDYILDAGTGVGNSAKLFSNCSNAKVLAIDASDSIEYAYKKYGKEKNLFFIQADIRKLPFKKNFFDFICSDQVLHHTKDTETSFKYLTKFLAKKASIAIYVYKKKGPLREFADDYLREKLVKGTEKECIQFSKDMSDLGKSISLLNKKIKIPRDIPVLNIKAGTYDIQRFIYWNFLKCWWSADVPYEQSVATNFDWYFPKFAYRHTEKEVRKWYSACKLKIIHFNEIESGYSLIGRK